MLRLYRASNVVGKIVLTCVFGSCLCIIALCALIIYEDSSRLTPTIPSYPNARNTTKIPSPKSDYWYDITFETNDPPNTIHQFYTDHMPFAGWKIRESESE